jgi:TniQ
MTTTAGTRRRERRPLPRPVPPVQNETTVSYIQRLARANHIRADELAEYLDARMTTSGRHVSVQPQVLADAAGMDVSHLLLALPQLQAGPKAAAAHVTSSELRLACRRCMAARNVFSAVAVLAWADQNVCLRHQLWIGHGVTSINDQADVAGMPEVSRSQARHQRLARHHGLRRVRDCYKTAESTIDWSSREPSSQTARQERIRRLLAVNRTGSLPRSYDYAAYYPEVVGILSVLASPYWQRIAGSGDPDDALRFYRQISANGLTNGTPRENNPLRNWIVELRAERRFGSR